MKVEKYNNLDEVFDKCREENKPIIAFTDEDGVVQCFPSGFKIKYNTEDIQVINDWTKGGEYVVRESNLNNLKTASYDETCDLKLIDSLLCLYVKGPFKSWEDIERDTNLVITCLERLRKAWESGEMKLITLSLANYFKELERKENND